MLSHKYIVKNIIFVILGLIISLIIGLYNTFPAIIVAILVISWYFYELYFFKYFIENKGNDYGFTTVKNSLPFPFVILKKDKILYMSDKFEDLFNTGKKGLSSITELIKDYDLGVKRQKVSFYGSTYILYSSNIFYKGNRNCEIVYFIQSLYGTNNNINEIEPVIVSLLFVDNYDDIIDSTEEIRRPLLIALIDRKINSLTRDIGGIVKKFEKDKYLLIFYRDKLDYLKEGKFEILDKMRKIDMGNKIPVTLSIGMGIDYKSLPKSMEYARQSLDLALGRGGDQVLIKDSEKFYFYGGVSREIGTNTRVRARVKAYALSELIDEARDIIIMGHQNSDLDCLGSAIGVHAIVRSFGKRSKIVLNKITTSIDILYNRLMKEEDYKEVFINSKEAMEMITNNTLLVIVDTHRPSILESQNLLYKTNKVVVFDHHRKSTEFIDSPVLSYHEPYASSTSELITEMLKYIKHEVNLMPVECDALLAGITVDTKSFAFKTGTKTFEAAAYLKRKGGDSIRVKLLFQNKMESYKAKAIAVSNAEIFNYNMAISICPSGIENPTLVTAQAADDLLNIFGIVASFVLSEEHDRILVSARSLGSVNVQLIMEKLGGGGHQTVAGAQIPNTTINQAMVKLKNAIELYNQEVKK